MKKVDLSFYAAAEEKFLTLFKAPYHKLTTRENAVRNSQVYAFRKEFVVQAFISNLFKNLSFTYQYR